MNKKQKILLENIDRNLEEIRQAKETNKAVIKIRELVLAFQNGYLTEGEENLRHAARSKQVRTAKSLLRRTPRGRP